MSHSGFWSKIRVSLGLPNFTPSLHVTPPDEKPVLSAGNPIVFICFGIYLIHILLMSFSNIWSIIKW